METSSSSRVFSIAPEVQTLAVSHIMLDQPVPSLKRQTSERGGAEAAGTVEILNAPRSMLQELTTLSFSGYCPVSKTKLIVFFDHISDVEDSP